MAQVCMHFTAPTFLETIVRWSLQNISEGRIGKTGRCAGTRPNQKMFILLAQMLQKICVWMSHQGVLDKVFQKHATVARKLNETLSNWKIDGCIAAVSVFDGFFANYYFFVSCGQMTSDLRDCTHRGPPYLGASCGCKTV